MIIEYIIVAHNSVPHFERLALSLHNQTYDHWRASLLNINSTDALAKFMRPLNKTILCKLLKDRFFPVDLSLEPTDDWPMLPPDIPVEQRVDQSPFWNHLKAVLEKTPLANIIGFIPCNHRPEPDLGELVISTLQQPVDACQVEFASYDPDYASRFIYFVKRSLLVKQLPPIVVPDPVHGYDVRFSFPQDVKIVRAGQMPFGYWF